MTDILSSQFTKEEIQLCLAIGEGEEELADKISKLFQELEDPLLSPADVQQLLATEDSGEEYAKALEQLTKDGTLDQSLSTQRALDKDLQPLFRRKLHGVERLKLIAIESQVADESRRYQFSCDGRVIRSLAKIDRLDALSGEGQQREEILNHVKNIAQGIMSGIQIPNAILLTINDDTCSVDPSEEEPVPESFVVIRGLSDVVEVPNPYAPGGAPVQSIRTVEIDFPYRPAAFDDEKAALLVDGQQRTAALSMVDVDEVPTIDLAVIAVVADTDEAKTVFQVANSTQRIKTEFSRALMAAMGDAPGYIASEQNRARACRILAIDDDDSPFKGIVKYPGLKNDRARFVAYNSLFQVVTLFADSALFIEEDTKAEELSDAVKKSYTAVKETWPESWGKKPGAARLMHGAGLRAVASLCVDNLTAAVRQFGGLDKQEVWDDLKESLARLRTVVLWDESALGGNKTQAKHYRDHISKAQNTSQDIADLTKFLLKESLAVDKAAKKKSQ